MFSLSLVSSQDDTERFKSGFGLAFPKPYVMVAVIYLSKAKGREIRCSDLSESKHSSLWSPIISLHSFFLFYFLIMNTEFFKIFRH